MKLLIAYYSYSGITKRLAEDIALVTDGELRELKPQKPYSFSHNTAVKEARYEIENKHCPPLIEGAEPVGEAEVIFIGSPNWLKSFAPPVLTFLKTVDLSEKIIIPFCTHGGGGFGRMMQDYKNECNNSIIKYGLALEGDYSFDELQNWLNNNL